ncbi:hypothetical protein BH23GEM5_BH23GEM5_20890 [soil metagenome]
MFSHFASHTAEPHLVPPSSRRSVAVLRRRVHELDPTLPASSRSFHAAVLLLAAEQGGQNIEWLARFTGYPREFVAKCARRLYDNGVWRSGATVSRWTGNHLDSNAFWADVGVAEGKTCRRIGESGDIEWARAGLWTKSYDFIEQATLYEPGVRYLPSHLQSEPVEELAAYAEAASPPKDGTEGEIAVAPGFEPDTESHPDAGKWSASQDVTHTQPATPLPELFADAVWLT